MSFIHRDLLKNHRAFKIFKIPQNRGCIKELVRNLFLGASPLGVWNVCSLITFKADYTFSNVLCS
jgi:hypothetical protein